MHCSACWWSYFAWSNYPLSWRAIHSKCTRACSRWYLVCTYPTHIRCIVVVHKIHRFSILKEKKIPYHPHTYYRNHPHTLYNQFTKDGPKMTRQTRGLGLQTFWQCWQCCIIALCQVLLYNVMQYVSSWTNNVNAQHLHLLSRQCACKGTWAMNRAVCLVGEYEMSSSNNNSSTVSTVSTTCVQCLSVLVPDRIRDLALWNYPAWTVDQCTDAVYTSTQHLLLILQQCSASSLHVLETHLEYFKRGDLRRLRRICTRIPTTHCAQQYYQCMQYVLGVLTKYTCHHTAPASSMWVDKCTNVVEYFPCSHLEQQLLHQVHTIQSMFHQVRVV